MPQEPTDSNDSNEATTHLSEAELRDLVVACVPANISEALYLVTRLDEAGIPASQMNDALQYPAAQLDIRVPRVLLAKSQEVIHKAREDAKQQALENAYNIDDVDARDLEKDPVLLEMADLYHVPMESKRALLIDRTINWFSTGCTDAQIARYLSMAGLSQDETMDLVREISQRHQASFKTTQKHYHILGWALIGFGLLCALFGFVAMPGPRQYPATATGLMCFMMGLVVLYGASKKPQDSALAKEPESKK